MKGCKIVAKTKDSLQPARPVKDFSDPLVQQSIQDLKDTLQAQQLELDKINPGKGAGVGLASNQIEYCQPHYPKGFTPFDMYVVSIRSERAKSENCAPVPLQVFINATYQAETMSKALNYEEGCLSIMGIKGLSVPRESKIKLTAFNEHGKQKTIAVDGFIARVHQHEMDHCRGGEYLNQMNFSLAQLQQIQSWAKQENASLPIIKDKLMCVSSAPDFAALLAWVEDALAKQQTVDHSNKTQSSTYRLLPR